MELGGEGRVRAWTAQRGAHRASHVDTAAVGQTSVNHVVSRLRLRRSCIAGAQGGAEVPNASEDKPARLRWRRRAAARVSRAAPETRFRLAELLLWDACYATISLTRRS